ncbi:MAG: cytochrome P450, partial [Pyrinomonadaceae bacterium]|nr:cytochrome P450 [Pyrinomonadaceae bacterium]
MKQIQPNSPPTVKADLFGGHFRSFRKNPVEFLQNIARLGDVTTFRMGSIPVFLVNHPDLVRDLLVTNHSKFIKGRALQRAKGLLGEGLLTSEKEFHLRQRRMIQPAFHRARISGYAESMIEFSERLSGEWRDGDVRDIDKEMMRLTLWIVGKTLFSANVEDEAAQVGAAMTTIVSMFNFMLFPFSEILEKLPLPPIRRLKLARKTLDEVIYKIIDERRKSGADKGDLLSMLLLAQDEETGGAMTDKQVRDECLTLFLAGHETTANALVWTFYLLSQNPAAEKKFHAELDEVLGDKSLTPEDYPRLKYTEQILAESMRLFPPAWTVGRLAVEEHEFGGYKISEKSLVLASQFVMHRDERFWENPNEFVPERWEKLSIKEAGNKFVYFPFSKGVRSCIGESFAWMEGVLLLAGLGRRWKLSLMPDQKIAVSAMITLRPKFGMKMKIEKRSAVK